MIKSYYNPRELITGNLENAFIFYFKLFDEYDFQKIRYYMIFEDKIYT